MFNIKQDTVLLWVLANSMSCVKDITVLIADLCFLPSVWSISRSSETWLKYDSLVAMIFSATFLKQFNSVIILYALGSE